MIFNDDYVSITFRKDTDSFGGFIMGEKYDYFPKVKYIMEVRSNEFFADISMKIQPSMVEMTDAIASCLVAGLKLIDGYEMVYDAVVSKFKTNLGIIINREVQKEIGVINDTYLEYNNRPMYVIDIPLGFGFEIPGIKDTTAFFIEESSMIKIEFKFINRGNSIVVRNFCEADLFHESGGYAMKRSQYEALTELHSVYPQYGMDWEIVRNLWFGNSDVMKKMGVDSYVSDNFHGEPPAVKGPPEDVRKLPGVDEMVKNPVHGGQQKLWNAIVDLNDKQGWTREQIADWVETLDIDISFGSESE